MPFNSSRDELAPRIRNGLRPNRAHHDERYVPGCLGDVPSRPAYFTCRSVIAAGGMTSATTGPPGTPIT